AALVDAVGELLEHACTLRVAQGGGARDVPGQLHACGRRVHVLPAGAAAARCAEGQLAARHGDAAGDVKGVLGHSVGSVGSVLSRPVSFFHSQATNITAPMMRSRFTRRPATSKKTVTTIHSTRSTTASVRRVPIMSS